MTTSLIRVFVWKPVGSNVGHASALVVPPAPVGEVYVSWWPDPNKEWTADYYKGTVEHLPGRSLTYEEDLRAEGFEPNYTCDIEGLDANAALDWWQDFQVGEGATYSLLKQNCSWAIVSLLKAAGADARLPWYRWLEKHNADGRVFADHGAYFTDFIQAIIVKIAKNEEDIENWSQLVTLAIRNSVLEFGDKVLLTWSPLDTIKYCQAITHDRPPMELPKALLKIK